MSTAPIQFTFRPGPTGACTCDGCSGRRRSTASEAEELIHGDRASAYGDKRENFTRIGRLWGALLGIPDVTPEMVGLCMVAVKLAREVNLPGKDNRRDGIGYLILVDDLEDENAAQPSKETKS